MARSNRPPSKFKGLEDAWASLADSVLEGTDYPPNIITSFRRFFYSGANITMRLLGNAHDAGREQEQWDIIQRELREYMIEFVAETRGSNDNEGL